MWDKSRQYLRKMGGVILVASIIIWFLGYFPMHSEADVAIDNQIALVEQKYDNKEIPDSVKEEQISLLEGQKSISQAENSYIGKIGKFIEPVVEPLGFDWRIGVSLASGMAAKEVVVSTFGVLYTGTQDQDETSEPLRERIAQSTKANGSPVFTPLVVISLLVFVLIYFPCVAVIAAIKGESGSWKWGIFTVIYTTGLAWILSFIIYQVGSLLIG